MKKCSTCDVDMLEDYSLKGTKSDLYVQKEGICGLSINSVKIAICPKCGKVEMYVDPDKLQTNF